MAELAIPQTEVFFTPRAFEGLHEKGLVVTPNAEHIARMGEIIGNELPDRALPTEVEELAIIIQGRTSKTDKPLLFTSWDVLWLKADASQLYVPGDELRKANPNDATTVTKADVAQTGRFILEFAAVNRGSWGEDRSKRFMKQWIARRALDSVAKNVPHELAGAASDIIGIGSKAKKEERIFTAILDEGLDPFIVTQRRIELPS